MKIHQILLSYILSSFSHILASPEEPLRILDPLNTCGSEQAVLAEKSPSDYKYTPSYERLIKHNQQQKREQKVNNFFFFLLISLLYLSNVMKNKTFCYFKPKANLKILWVSLITQNSTSFFY